MILWIILRQIKSKKAGQFSQMSQKLKLPLEACFGKVMSAITEQIQPFLEEFTWGTG